PSGLHSNATARKGSWTSRLPISVRATRSQLCWPPNFSCFATGPWSKTSPQDRSKLIWKLTDLLESHADEFAQLESTDNCTGAARWATRYRALCRSQSRRGDALGLAAALQGRPPQKARQPEIPGRRPLVLAWTHALRSSNEHCLLATSPQGGKQPMLTGN